MGMWRRYVPVAQRQRKAQKQMEKLKKQGKTIQPVLITGRQISTKFWGKKWCEHIDTFADYDNRLPRGRSYVRNGSVCHLTIREGICEAYVSGSELYTVVIHIQPLAKKLWEQIQQRCRGKVGSIIELLQGQLSDQVMELVADHKEGLFPKEKEMSCSCSCPDWATMCKHVVAVIYGIGNRLDERPELLFQLRGVDPKELISGNLSLDTAVVTDQLQEEDISSIFGIDLDDGALQAKLETLQPVNKQVVPKPPSATKKGALERSGAKQKERSLQTAMIQPSVVRRVEKSKRAAKPAEPVIDLSALTGKKLRKLREKKRLTVLELANQLGVTAASIYRWEESLQPLKLQARSRERLQAFLTQQR